jgi:hypothetical protein
MDRELVQPESDGGEATSAAPASTTLSPYQATAQRLQSRVGNRAAARILRAPAKGPTGMGIKERMASLAGGGMQDPKAQAAKAQLDAAAQAKAQAEKEEKLTADAFRSSTFYYGTTGGTSVLKSFIDTLTARSKKPDAGKLQYYWPGERAKQYIADRTGQSGSAATPASPKTPNAPAMPATPKVEPRAGSGEQAQMMDMYYGQEGQQLHELRNPQIGKYVHEKMGYAGAYDQHKHGRDSYMENYSKGENAGLEGWAFPQLPKGQKSHDQTSNDYSKALFQHPDTGEALSGTMEISRYIRDGIFKYGGKLIFENKNVYNEGSFLTGVRQGDTNKEAVALFPYFAKSPKQSKVAFGKGTLIFHFGGSETVPTQVLFRQLWAFGKPPLSAEDAKTVIPADNLFWKFPRGAGLKLAGEKVMAQNRAKPKAEPASGPK